MDRIVPAADPRRNGLPLPATTAADAVSQLIWRALGPDRRKVQPALTWSLFGHEGAAAEGWTHSQVDYRIALVNRVGRTTPIGAHLAATLADPVDPWAARARRLFALPTPPKPRLGLGEAATIAANARTAERILAAVGPLPMDRLLAAVHHTRRYRTAPAPTAAQLATGLRRLGATTDLTTGRWTAAAGVAPWPRDAAILAATDPTRTYSHAELFAVMVDAGYSPRSAHQTMGRHPLTERVGYDKWQVHGHADTARAPLTEDR